MPSILVIVASSIAALVSVSTADTAPASCVEGLSRIAQQMRIAEIGASNAQTTVTSQPMRVAEIETQQENLDADVHHPGQKGDEAEAILKESKDSFKVTHQSFEDCMKDWGPSTQMSKEEWAQSCRSTLKYFPEGK
ncbi:hypothetical protein [Hyphomicrobium sulfonivorans]|nr:hypothetical protein [Hyphomicrobium sulfonivorans]